MLPFTYNRKIYLLLTLITFVLVRLTEAQRGAIVLPRNLAQLSGVASVIVRAHVIGTQLEPSPTYPNLNSIVVTLSVEEVLKGTVGKNLTFRQFVWDPRDRANRLGYRQGDEMVLFLNAVTSAGFTSPVGLEQGRFRVQQGSKGERFISNGASNRGLFAGMQQLPETSKLSARTRQVLMAPTNEAAPLPYDTAKEMIHAFARFKDKLP